MKKTFITILIFLIPQILLAGSFSINQKFPARGEEIKVGDDVLLEIRLVTGENFYNAVGGTVQINTDDFLIKKVGTGNNVITAWVENPSKANTGKINFSGIMAGGFSGNGLLFELVLVPKRSGNLNLNLSNLSIFLNDGLGTQEEKSDIARIFEVRDLLPSEENFILHPRDTTPPENFEVFLVRDENIADGKYVLIFEAIDKGSGVRMYEAIEGRLFTRNAESPFVLNNQKINKKIWVKAIDNEGNERLVRVNIPDKICVGINCFNEKYLLIVITLILIASFVIWRKQKKSLKVLQERL